MNTRLEQFLAAENISQSQFADTIDVARASVSHILAGRNKPGWDFLNNMLKHYPNLNIEWLLNGTGKMYKSAARETTVKQEPAQPDLFSAAELPDMEKAASIKVSETPRELNIPVQPRMVSPNTQIPQTPPTIENVPQCTDNQRKITKIVVFYDDNTFIGIM